MSGLPILDLVAGIIFVYFLLSIISSSAIEVILTGLKARARLLEDWLFKVFDKPFTPASGPAIPLGQAIIDHCATTVLSAKGKSTSYIDSKNFTAALLEKITFDPARPNNIAKNIDEVITALEKTTILSTEFQRVLLSYANDSKDTYASLSEKTVSELELFRGKIENWYDSSMDRLTGALKKKYSRPATFVVGIIVTVCLNADSIALAKYLYSNPEARTKVAAEAFNAGKDTVFIQQVQQLTDATGTASKHDSIGLEQIKSSIEREKANIEKAKLALGDVMPLTWKAGELDNENGHLSPRKVFAKVTGLLATILALMMGAPFWFDVLNKVSNLRSTGVKPAISSSEEEKKKRISG